MSIPINQTTNRSISNVTKSSRVGKSNIKRYNIKFDSSKICVYKKSIYPYTKSIIGLEIRLSTPLNMTALRLCLSKAIHFPSSKISIISLSNMSLFIEINDPEPYTGYLLIFEGDYTNTCHFKVNKVCVANKPFPNNYFRCTFMQGFTVLFITLVVLVLFIVEMYCIITKAQTRRIHPNRPGFKIKQSCSNGALSKQLNTCVNMIPSDLSQIELGSVPSLSVIDINDI